MVTCEICGRSVPPTYSIIDSDTSVTLCQDCYPLQGTCRTCAKDCALEKDTSNEPKVIQQQQQVRLPNGAVATTVKNVINPSLAEKYCTISCPCFGLENGCLKQTIGMCSNYTPLYNNKNI